MLKLERGQFVTGRKSLTDDLNRGVKPDQQLSEKSWSRYLKNLEKWKMLSIKVTNKFSIVTIENYSVYQDFYPKVDHQTVQQVTNNCPTSDQQLTTNNNGNKGKNEKKNKYADFVTLLSSEYEKLLNEFGEQGTAERIERLNLYKGSTGKKYKSDYLTILNWEKKNKSQKKANTVSWEDL